MIRGDAGGGAAEDAGDGREAVLLCRRPRGDDQAAAPSLTPEALPAVTEPPSRNGAFSLASCSSVVSGAGARRRRPRSGRPCGCGIDHRRDFLRETAEACAAGAGLASQRKGVLVVAADAEILGDVLGRLGHGIDAVLRLQQPD
jgi:hypothetical protein